MEVCFSSLLFLPFVLDAIKHHLPAVCASLTLHTEDSHQRNDEKRENNHKEKNEKGIYIINKKACIVSQSVKERETERSFGFGRMILEAGKKRKKALDDIVTGHRKT